MKFPTNLIRRFARDCRGTSVIEFALFAPILAVMMMGMTDVTMAYSQKISVEQAAFRALEKVTVGSVQTDYNYLRAEAAAADGPGGVQASNVTVNAWRECNQVVQPLFDGNCAPGEMLARYVSVSIATTYTPMFFEGPLAATGNADGTVPLTAVAAVRIQ